ncbi:MAG: hypothetical protein ING08_07710 [Roseomonas sp.]|nr:hypothetical protein [Roseomonas sp.]
MRSLNDAHQRYSHSDIAEQHPAPQAHPQKFGRVFSKCKSCNGNKGGEEQKMFTSQKCFLPMRVHKAQIFLEAINTAFINEDIALPCGNANQKPPATFAGADS